MFLTILFLINCLILGVLLYTLVLKKLPSKPADFFLALSLLMTLISILSMVLLEISFFKISVLTSIIFISNIILGFVLRKYFNTDKIQQAATSIKKKKKDYLISFCLILLTISIISPAFPWIYGGRDPGIYIDTGINIAKSGSLTFKNEIIKESTDEEKFILMNYEKDRPETIKHKGWLYVGFYYTDEDTGEFTPQFFALFQIWIAIFYLMFGLSGAIFSTNFLGLLGILGIYFFTKAFFSKKIAFLATFFALISFTQIWWSKYPNAEIVTQMFFLSGLILFNKAIKTSKKTLALISGLVFGIQYLSTIQSYMVFLLLWIFLPFTTFLKKQRIFVSFYIGNIVIFLYSLIHAYIFSAPYLNTWIASIARKAAPPFYITIPFLIISILLTLLFTNIIREKVTSLKRVLNMALLQRLAQIILIGIILFSIARVFLDKTSKEGLNIVKISIYLGFIGIIPYLQALFTNLFKRRSIIITFIVFTSIGIFSLMLYKARISIDHPWWSRRFFPYAIGLFPILVSVSFFHFWDKNSKWLKTSAVMFAGILTLLLSGINLLLFNYTEHEESVKKLEHINSLLEEDSILLFSGNSNEREKYVQGYFAAPPLRFIYGRETFVITEKEQTDYKLLNSKIATWLEEGKHVYIAGTHPFLVTKLSKEFYLQPIDSYTLSFKQRGWRSVFFPSELYTDDRLTTTVTTFSVDDTLFELAPRHGEFPFLEGDFFSDIGEEDENTIGLTGTHKKEQFADTTYRWTEPDFSVFLPYRTQESALLKINASLLQMTSEREVTIDVTACGKSYTYNLKTEREFKEISIPIEQNCLLDIDIHISPEYTTEGDSRVFGIAIDDIIIDI